MLGGVSSPLREEGDVAEKYQPEVDWFKSYLGSGTYSHLEKGMKERGAKDYYMDAAKESQERYVREYPYNVKGRFWAGESPYDPEGYYEEGGDSIGPSIKEGYKVGARGSYRKGKSDETGVITINPNLSESEQKEVMTHELGHTDRKILTGDRSVRKEVGERNPYYKKLVGLLSEEKGEIGENIRKLLNEGDPENTIPNVVNDWLYYKDAKDLAKTLNIEENEANTLKWAAAPYEVRSELVKLRYQLEKEGIYKSTGDYKEFTKDHLNKIKKTKQGKNILLDGKFKDKDVIWYMNNIAMEEGPSDDLKGSDMYAHTGSSKTGGV